VLSRCESDESDVLITDLNCFEVAREECGVCVSELLGFFEPKLGDIFPDVDSDVVDNRTGVVIRRRGVLFSAQVCELKCLNTRKILTRADDSGRLEVGQSVSVHQCLLSDRLVILVELGMPCDGLKDFFNLFRAEVVGRQFG